MLVYTGCETFSILNFVRSAQAFYLAQAALRQLLVLSPGAALLLKANGVGFSVSVIVSKGLGILKRRARPQSPHLARCLCIGDRPLGFTHPSRQFPREVYATGLDVGSSALLPEPTPTYCCFTDRGNFFLISSTVAYTIGLTWGGITAPWSSTTVLVPLVLGFVGLFIFLAYEATYATYPLVCASPCALM